MTDADSVGMLICKLNCQVPLSYQSILFCPGWQEKIRSINKIRIQTSKENAQFSRSTHDSMNNSGWRLLYKTNMYSRAKSPKRNTRKSEWD